MHFLRRLSQGVRRKLHEWRKYSRNQMAIAQATRVLGAHGTPGRYERVFYRLVCAFSCFFWTVVVIKIVLWLWR